MMARQKHFARVEPIVGPCLRRARVALIGLPWAAPLVVYLAASGVGRWLWALDPRSASGSVYTCAPADALHAYLLAQHGDALDLDLTAPPRAEWAAAVAKAPPDLVVGVGDGVDLRAALEAARAARVPALLVAPPAGVAPCRAFTWFPGDDCGAAGAWVGTADAAEPPHERSTVDSSWGWTTAAPLCAGLARAVLLRDTEYRRADLAELWANGVRVFTIGANDDPFAVDWSPWAPGQGAIASPRHAGFRTPQTPRGNLLIAGLGSLGSVAAMLLADHARSLVVADPDRVDGYNPVRQAYPASAIGHLKADVLRNHLIAAGANDVVAIGQALRDERAIGELIERHGITAALVTTGTAADFAIARALRARDLPHLVGRCYPRARYWEAIVVDGRRGPALSDIRGQLIPGPSPGPTPEQIAAYSDAGALEAEPATLVESGWAAAWMARLTAQLLAPLGLRERWLLELLAAERTCLVGGVGVEPTADGPAYGIERPGAIRAWVRAAIRRR
jgi:molybdopterin/thiamine biosynthesis adenylyltransferase